MAHHRLEVEHVSQPTQQRISQVRVTNGSTSFVGSNTTYVTNNNIGLPSIELEIAKEALFDAAGRDHDPLCLPGTRNDLLQDIRTWLSSGNQEHIYWLSGWAGTGKSTIARTIAQEYPNSPWHLGTFFFSKGGGDAGHIHKFVGTLAMQLSYRWPAFKNALQRAISTDEGIVRRTQRAQWAALILQPLSELLASPSPERVLLVIDALDECGTNDDMSHIVELLLDARGVEQTALRIFVTSRPEISIRNRFDGDGDQHHLNLVLHQISEFVVQNDLFIFLRHHFTKIRQSRRLGVDWPGDTDIHRLVEMSGNLFIWAATVCRFVSKDGILVKNRLSSILGRSNDLNGPEKELDLIYLTVLENAIGDDLSEEEKAEVSRHFRYVLGTITALFAPLSVVGLGSLLRIKTEEIQQRLADFHSILDVPTNTDGLIRLHHPSFRDFLQDPNRCCNDFLYVNSNKIHFVIAERCIKVMSTALRRDICSLKDPGILVEDIESADVIPYLPSALQYSCRYWLDHSARGQVSLDDDGPVSHFLREYCLYWLEVMSIIGKVPEAIAMMIRLESLVDAKKAPELQSLVQDTLRFMRTFSHVLTKAPLQLYNTGIIFSPSQSIIRKSFGLEALGDIKVTTQVPEEWNACIQTLEGHIGQVNSAVFSSDGSRVASGSGDHTVRVWDVQTGQCQHTLEGHTGSVTSAVFSPDGSRVASGSYDHTVRVWDVQTGQCQHTLEGHTHWVTSAVFSPDGSRVASGSGDHTVRVWDVQTGQCQHTLEGHTGSVTSAVFSPDGSRVASGSDDHTVRVWDVQTGQCQHTLEGHTGSVTSAVFSPDGSRVASGSYDHTVRVWDVQTGQCQHTLEGHTGWVNSAVFSPDGSRVASGSDDDTVRVWDVQTGQCQHTLEGHTHWVTSAVFSPDGSRVASGSGDHTVRVWDVQTGQCQHTLEGHTGWVNSAVFSPDGSRVASGSDDHTVRVWDVQTGQCQHTLEGHTGSVTSAVFSPDGSRVASGSYDHTVRVWDVQKGQCQHTLEGHTGSVTSAVFSPDGSRVASGSYDDTVRVWDVQTGQCQHTLEGHTGSVTSAVFSPDGSRVASGSGDHTVRVWDVQTGQCQHTLEGHTGWVNSAVFSPDGSRVASGSYDHTVRVWDVQTGQCQHTLEGHTVSVTSAVFSPDGSRVASGSYDHTVRVWDVISSTELMCYHTRTHRHKIEFIDDSMKITVNGDLLSIPLQTQITSTATGPPGPSLNLPARKLSVIGDWVTLSSQRILWLPPEYRPGDWAGNSDTIVIGSGTGRVTFVHCAATRFLSL